MQVQVGDKVRSLEGKAVVTRVELRRVEVRNNDSGLREWKALLDFHAEYKSDAERDAARKVAALLNREVR
jgi:hypothetical protein